MRTMRVLLGPEEVTLSASRALVWAKTVFIADVHFGKDSAFRSRSHWVPPGATEENLRNISRLLRSFRAERLVILGDLFHSADALDAVPKIRRWRNRRSTLDILVIPGNHDRLALHLASECGFRAEPEGAILGPWTLRHHPCEDRQGFSLCGHIHPVASLRGGARMSVRVPCFAISSHQCILPAFGSLTGGYPIRPRVSDQIVGVTDDKLIKLL